MNDYKTAAQFKDWANEQYLSDDMSAEDYQAIEDWYNKFISITN